MIEPKGNSASFNELSHLHGRSLADGVNKADEEHGVWGTQPSVISVPLCSFQPANAAFIVKSQTLMLFLTRL
jgi:hypothetical protein